MRVSPLSSRKTSEKFYSETNERPDHPHCPLCIDSLLHPSKDPRSPAFIFLDMDGVMINGRHTDEFHQRMYPIFSRMFPGETNCDEYRSLYVNAELLDHEALAYLDHLIARIEHAGFRALIVLHTSWRSDAALLEFKEKIFKKHEFCKYLCGKAAPEKSEAIWSLDCAQGFDFTLGAKEAFNLDLKTTADAIVYWLKDHGFDPRTANFVAIDDQSTRGLNQFGPRFIQTKHLLDEKAIEQAVLVLKV